MHQTRVLSLDELAAVTALRSDALLQQGITTIEVKSGYGLSVSEELKILRAIQAAQTKTSAELIATCLAAHTLPNDFAGGHTAYLNWMANELFPVLITEKLTTRIDAFIEEGAFSADNIRPYFQRAKSAGFDLTVHADQFSSSGAQVALEWEALSADHLEVATLATIQQIAQSDVVAVALPGASLGLGCGFTPARQLLDAGASLAIATDWNPGSAPMGKLVASASILATMEKLTNAEVLAAITFRAAHALKLNDRGRLSAGLRADLVIYECDTYQAIPYWQGSLLPVSIWKNGLNVYTPSPDYEFA